MKKLRKKVTQLTTGAVTIGALSTIPISGVGAALQPVSAHLPTMGTLTGAGITLDLLKELKPKKRRK